MKFAAILAAVAALAPAQTPDPAYPLLAEAYQRLQAQDYDRAIPLFEQAIALAPARAAIRKDFAYTLLKTGETEAARDQFGAAMRLDAADLHVALEYAFLCFESPDREDARAIPFKAEARRIFDRIRHAPDSGAAATAAEAFRNIDAPLEAGIRRWTEALARSPSFSAHYELAQLAEQRDALGLAADHYLAAWQLLPARKSVLLDLGRVELARGRGDDARAALLAASRGGEPRAAEMARRLLPERYPFVYEFRRALALDPGNLTLHLELAYLLLRMAEKGEGKPEDAESEFRLILARHPDDLLSAAQLGLLALSRGDREQALPLLNRVIAGSDDDLANKARNALHLAPKLSKPAPAAGAADARIMADRSLQAGYLQDALKYLEVAHQADPEDGKVMYKLGSALNQLHNDAAAVKWFARARKADDPEVAIDAKRAYNNLRPDQELARVTTWVFPFFSTRWRDLFAYGQAKTEFKIRRLPLRPYVSVRFVGDTRETVPGGVLPQYLSESAFIVGLGVATRYWRHTMAWAEAGESIGYLNHRRVPDYRGGVSWSHFRGQSIYSQEAGYFLEANADSVFVSRFQNDLIQYGQVKFGLTPASRFVQTQFYWNLNLNFDARRQYWATAAEAGPGLRLHIAHTPKALVLSANYMRGVYLINAGNPRGPNFNDLRLGFWYALTH